ncbi:hypothetical protein [Psittacicella gerlachiana]|uniref:Uncharacterized protein n=1 Tax=Psittacicella gerlachiana TaxID=2028574 RepID=A0A3A1YIW5_9GAMM|nr:hypothetical protein [Psittacicella gerlachiana]RIY36184.1 hypothetical protein CKF59_02900 [Psittacicella gerlachiana]
MTSQHPSQENQDGEISRTTKRKRNFFLHFLVFCLGGVLGFAGYYFVTSSNLFKKEPPVTVVNKVTFTSGLEVLNQTLNTTDPQQLEDLQRLQKYVSLLQELRTFYELCLSYEHLSVDQQLHPTFSNFQSKFTTASQKLLNNFDFPLAFIIENLQPTYNSETRTYQTNLFITSSLQMSKAIERILPRLIVLNTQLKTLQEQLKNTSENNLTYRYQYIFQDLENIEHNLQTWKKSYPQVFDSKVIAQQKYQSSKFFTKVQGPLEVFFLPLNQAIVMITTPELDRLERMLLQIDRIKQFASLEAYIENYPFTPDNSTSLSELKNQYRMALNTLTYLNFKPVRVKSESKIEENATTKEITNYLLITVHPLRLPYEPINKFSYLECDLMKERDFVQYEPKSKPLITKSLARCYEPFIKELKYFNRFHQPSLNNVIVNDGIQLDSSIKRQLDKK